MAAKKASKRTAKKKASKKASKRVAKRVGKKVGKKAAKTGLPPGRLTLGINDNAHWQNNVGAYTVTVTATDAYDVGDPQ